MTEQIIQEFKNELKLKYPDYRGLYLFGSRAKGNFTDDSDIDLAAIFDRNIDWRFRNEIWDMVCYYQIEYDYLIDIHVFNYKDLIIPNSPLKENIKRDGIFYGV